MKISFIIFSTSEKIFIRTFNSINSQKFSKELFFITSNKNEYFNIKNRKLIQNNNLFFVEKNQIYKKINQCIKNSTGDYVCVLESETVFEENSLNILYEKCIESNPKFISGISSSKSQNVLSVYKSSSTFSFGKDRLNFFKKEFLINHNIKFENSFLFNYIHLLKVLSEIEYYYEIELPFKILKYYYIPFDNASDMIKYYTSCYELINEIYGNNFDYSLYFIKNTFLKNISIPYFDEYDFELLKNILDNYLKIIQKSNQNNIIYNVRRKIQEITDIIYNRITEFDVEVSIIIPTYNVEEYIDDCLNSLINQTFENIEIICVDDISTDSTKEIIQEYAQKDDRIIFLENEIKGGSGKSRNTGIKVAKGKYIQFVDSDDWIELDTVEKLYECAEKYEPQVLMFKAINFNHDTKLFYKDDYYSMNDLTKIENKMFKHEDITKNQFFKLMLAPWNKFLLKSFVVGTNSRFTEKFVHQDNPFSYNIFCESNRMLMIDEYYYNRRRREGSITTLNDEVLLGVIEITDEILKIFLKNTMYNVYTRELLNRIIYLLRHRYDSIQEEYKEEFYINAKDKINKFILEYNIFNDLNKQLLGSNKKFFKKIVVSTNFEMFEETYN